MERIRTEYKQLNTTFKPKVFVMMSGGVDSSVAAALLKKRGFAVRGIHIKMWSDPDIPCAFKEDRYEAMRAAAHVGIPFETWDLTAEYKREVVEYMIREYAAGRTPNPDAMCNREIKFGEFFRRAIQEGADFVATGHYARVCGVTRQKLKCKNTGQDSKFFRLLQAVYDDKDQSYFLWTLTQKQLRRCLFPIGNYTKPEVRVMARALKLPNAEKPDSQGICFIGELDLPEFLKKHIPARRGEVVTTSGRTVGEHDGLPFYTIGQRHGLGAGGGIPYYVTRKEWRTNTIRVAEGPYDTALFAKNLLCDAVNWISGVSPALPMTCMARIRYRQPLERCRVSATRRGALDVAFQRGQRAVTPGQSIVFYNGKTVLGGGVITA